MCGFWRIWQIQAECAKKDLTFEADISILSLDNLTYDSVYFT